MGPQISLKNISLSFGKEPVFKSLNLLIHPRDRIALVGRNGSGKSTLLKVLKGLVVQDDGERMLSRGLSIGYMEQDPNLSKFTKLYDYVYSGVLESNFHLIEMTGKNLGVDLEVSIKDSSGGERRRLEIARTLASKPKYLLLDEPLTGIDPVSIEEIKIIIKKLKQKNIGVLITDHNVRETLKIVDKVYIVNEGMIFFSGDPNEAISDDRIKKFYLGSDFSI